MSDTLRFIGVTKDATTAGPGKRYELFTKGCIRGVISPCEGCFNESTWTFEGSYREMTVNECVENIDKQAWNRQVTFCGGEPILQAIAITKVAKKLKKIDPSFHIILYTAYKLDALMKYGLKFTWVTEKHSYDMANALASYSHDTEETECEAIETDPDGDGIPEYESTKLRFTIATPEQIKELMQYVDIIVDGDYKHELRIPTAKYMNEGQFIGSSNQRVIDCMHTLKQGKLWFSDPRDYNETVLHHLRYSTCKCCGHQVDQERLTFCDDICAIRYENRQEELKRFGVK